MSESIRKVIEDAAENYDVHRGLASGIEFQRRRSDLSANEVPQYVESAQQLVDRQIQRSAAHFAENEGAYKDAAAIDAHMDGVSLNVDHPLHNQKS